MKTTLTEINEKGKLLQKAIVIVEKLSKSGIADIDGCNIEYISAKDMDAIKNLIIESRSLTSDNWWELLKK